MKVVFPCNGSIVLTKRDIEILESFYNTKLMTSKMYEYYKNSEFMIQVGNLNYLPKNYSLILENTNLLSIQKLRNILYSNNTNDEIAEEEPISDDNIISHPFFETLKPLD